MQPISPLTVLKGMFHNVSDTTRGTACGPVQAHAEAVTIDAQPRQASSLSASSRIDELNYLPVPIRHFIQDRRVRSLFRAVTNSSSALCARHRFDFRGLGCFIRSRISSRTLFRKTPITYGANRSGDSMLPPRWRLINTCSSVFCRISCARSGSHPRTASITSKHAGEILRKMIADCGVPAARRSTYAASK